MLLSAAAFSLNAAADRVMLADGTVVSGRATQLDAEAIGLTRCGEHITYLRSAVRSVEFDSESAHCTASSDPASNPKMPAGTRLVVTLSHPIELDQEPDNQIFGGSLSEAIIESDHLLARRGAPVLMQLRPAGTASRHGIRELHLTAVRLDHGWATLDVTADETPVADGTDTAAGNLLRDFTLRQPVSLEARDFT
jgi:hypothetical protein